MNPPRAIVVHKYLKMVTVIRQIRQQNFFYLELLADDVKMAVAASIDMLFGPTDQPLDSSSSTYYTDLPPNRHNPTTLGNDTGLI